MIMRIWLISGLLIVVVAWGLTVTLSPAPFQSSPASSAEGYRANALLPKPGEFTMSTEIGHDVFEVPETDAQHRTEESSAGPTHAMSGMTSMGGDAEPEHGEQAMPDMTAQAPAHGEPSMPGMTMGGDADAGHGEQAMPHMATQTPAHGEPSMPGMTMEGQRGRDQDEAAQMQAHGAPGHGEPSMPDMTGQAPGHGEAAMPGMAMGAEEGDGAEEGHAGGAGLAILPDMMAHMAQRTIEIEMVEWQFRPASLTVKQGEVVRLVVRNTGNLPHEFMFMPMAGMAAVNYRLERADWNLLEHEALFERELVLPGDSFEAVFRIEQSGTWMYMCMFPYHMQFGLMGAMATEGASMDGSMDMGGMKM